METLEDVVLVSSTEDDSEESDTSSVVFQEIADISAKPAQQSNQGKSRKRKKPDVEAMRSDEFQFCHVVCGELEITFPLIASPRKKRKISEKPKIKDHFPASVYKLISQPLPPEELCTKMVLVENHVPRIQKRKKPRWYIDAVNRQSRARLQFRDRWELWNIVSRDVTQQTLDKDNIVHISVRGSKRFVQIINSDYISIRLTMKIKKSSGHFLANDLGLVDQSDKTRFVPNRVCRRAEDQDQSQLFHEIMVELPPRKECTLLQLGAPNPDKPFEYTTTLEFGHANQQPDKDFKWMLPVQIENDNPVLCSQGFHGCMTHVGKFAFSIDLAVVEGTSVVCPRDGVVIDLISHYKEAGVDQSFETKANYLTVAHSDGTVSEYVHLQHNGVCVELGEVVKKGQIIAKSGNTGWSYGPHLHFHVRENANKGSSTFAIRFDDGSPEGTELKTGHYYH